VLEMNDDLIDRIMAVINAEPDTPENLPDKVLALTECIARILMLRLSDDPVTARAISESLTQRLLLRISEASISSNEFLN
jgi:hypothetical protein